MATDGMPDYVSTFLILSKQLQHLKEEEKICRTNLSDLQPKIGKWLQDSPNYEIALNFNGDQRTQYGNAGKLRFGIETRKEYLSKNSLSGYLYSFFTQMYPDKSNVDLEQLSRTASSFVWQSRKTTKNKPVVLRTFTKVTKRTLKNDNV
jgi:hypothetical protein